MAAAKTQTRPDDAMSALQAAVAAAPDLGKEIAAVKAAQTIFDNIQQKAREAHGTDYVAELNSTHANLVAAQARHDIGRCSDDDLAQAKSAYAAAQDKANMAPGRRAVLLEELERSRDAIQDAVDALDDAHRDWADNVGRAARRAERLALELLVSASHALSLLDADTPQVHAVQIVDVLPSPMDRMVFAGGGALDVTSNVNEPHQISFAAIVRRRAVRSVDYIPDIDRMSKSIAENREAQLTPEAIERSRQAALAKANHGHQLPKAAESKVPSNSGVEGYRYPTAASDARPGSVPYAQF